MFFTVAQTGQTKELLSFYDNWRLWQQKFMTTFMTPSSSCLEEEGEVRGCSAATCNFTTKFYTP